MFTLKLGKFKKELPLFTPACNSGRKPRSVRTEGQLWAELDKLKKGKYMIKNYGFIAPEITVSDYIFGSLDKSKTLKGEVIRPDGQWDNDLPEDEIQRRYNFETMNCTNFGTLNCKDTLENAQYKSFRNDSERFLGVISGTTPSGNNPHNVAEAIRNKGLISEESLPWNPDINTWAEYYSPKPMTQNYLDLASEWLLKYDFGHEYAFHGYDSLKTKQTKIMESLKYSPIGISVCAWHYRNGMYYKPTNGNDNHWVEMYGYVKDKYWKIFDSYDNTRKKVEWNTNFGFAKKYQLKKKTTNMLKKKIEQIYQELLLRGWKELEDGSAYLNMDEAFVRKEVGASAERKQIIALVNWARSWKVINLFSGKK